MASYKLPFLDLGNMEILAMLTTMRMNSSIEYEQRHKEYYHILLYICVVYCFLQTSSLALHKTKSIRLGLCDLSGRSRLLCLHLLFLCPLSPSSARILPSGLFTVGRKLNLQSNKNRRTWALRPTRPPHWLGTLSALLPSGLFIKLNEG